MAFECGFGRTLGQFGVTLGALAAYGGAFWGHFEVILGSVWGQFGVSLGSVWVSVGDFGSLDGHFAMIVKLLWVY